MTPKQFLVVDIPADATAEQAEALLNGASGDYYMRSLNMCRIRAQEQSLIVAQPSPKRKSSRDTAATRNGIRNGT